MELQALKYLCEQAGGGLLPVLTMVHVYDTPEGRRAQAGNGRYVVDMPTDLPVCTVSADRLLAAYTACKGAAPEARTTDKFLMLKSGRIQARIQLSDPTTYPCTTPTEKTAHSVDGVSALLTRLTPFVATDASKPWAVGICLKDGYAYATNNVILVRAPFPAVLPRPVILPSSVFDAVIAKGEPVAVGADDNALTFYFQDGVWLKTQLIAGDWPTHVVDGFVDQLHDENWQTPHADLGLMMHTAARVADSRVPVVEFVEGGLRLVDDSFSAADLDPLPGTGKVNAKMTALVFEHATQVQWHAVRRDVHAFRAKDIVGMFGGHR